VGHHCSSPRLTSWHPQERCRRRAGFSFPLSSPLCSTLARVYFVISLVRSISSWDRPGRRAKGHLQRAASAQTADSGQENRAKCTPP